MAAELSLSRAGLDFIIPSAHGRACRQSSSWPSSVEQRIHLQVIPTCGSSKVG